MILGGTNNWVSPFTNNLSSNVSKDVNVDKSNINPSLTGKRVFLPASVHTAPELLKLLNLNDFNLGIVSTWILSNIGLTKSSVHTGPITIDSNSFIFLRTKVVNLVGIISKLVILVKVFCNSNLLILFNIKLLSNSGFPLSVCNLGQLEITNWEITLWAGIFTLFRTYKFLSSTVWIVSGYLILSRESPVLFNIIDDSEEPDASNSLK